MNKLLEQIAKFGIVGVIAFLVDFFIYTALNWIFRATGVAETFPSYYLLSQFISFVISCITNYLLSMKYVFERREDLSRQKEFVIFFLLSAIGLVINEIVLYIGMDLVYENSQWLKSWMGTGLAETFFKCFATGIVMVYNFISRKLTLEKKN